MIDVGRPIGCYEYATNYLLPPSALADMPLTAVPFSAVLEAILMPLNLNGNTILCEDLPPTSAANLNKIQLK